MEIASVQTGYKYPIPENPLTLPPKRTTEDVEPTSVPVGYNYPTPVNPLTLPPRRSTTTPRGKPYGV